MKQTAHADSWHTIIIGAGASGLMCAGSFDAPKLVLEHNAGAGAKLNITGGGKCNIANVYARARDYVGESPHFSHAALAAFTPQDMLALLQQAHLSFTEKENGQIFTQNARQVTKWLYKRAKAAHTTFSFHTQVLNVVYQNGLFCVQSSKGKHYAKHLVLASGGLSYPSLGATGLAWQVAAKFGLRTLEARPALAGLQMPKKFRDICCSLTGNSLPVRIQIGKHSQEGQLLFTHLGISGPVVLQSSLYWQEGQEISINFLPGTDVLSYLRTHKNKTASFSKLLTLFIPVKISKALLGELDIRISDAPKEVLRAVAQRLNQFYITPVSTSGYLHAEVTRGGVAGEELIPSTLECKKIPGLFVIGEAVDVTGRLGGFNLQWAWSSAIAAARMLSKKV